MKFHDLEHLINEAIHNKDLEQVVAFIKTLKTDNVKKISTELKKKFPKLSDKDIELAVSLI